ncbi:MAG TPA: hypothetical protein VHN15_04660, partial [Thermoanaerobaculia bacterium]|nr:hypothetical protein [Thermoanaerobaculia bacterium]
MSTDSPGLNPELPDGAADLGTRLLRRATDPGLVRHGLGAGIQRRSWPRGPGLAAEIQRRWASGEAAAWGEGS